MSLLPQDTTSELLKAKQYAAATAFEGSLLAIMMFVRWKWGYIIFGEGTDTVTLGFILYCAKNIVLIFLVLELAATIHHFYLWNKKGRPKSDDDHNSLFSDWKNGERSPLKMAMVMLVGFACLMVVAVIMWS